MLNSSRFLTLFPILISFLFAAGSIYSQNKEGFYDPYNYDLRNLKTTPPEGEEESYREYKVPPNFTKPALVSPKRVQRAIDLPFPVLSGASANPVVPQQNQGGPAGSSLSSSQASQGNAPPINPLTGEINTAAYLQQNEQKQRQKEFKEKEKKKFVEEKPYEETKLRRFDIIFFLTLPPAMALSGGVVGAMGLVNTFPGAVLIFLSGTGLAATNAYLDQKDMEEHEEEKKRLASSQP